MTAQRQTLFTISDDLLALDSLLDDVGGDVSDPQVEAAVSAWFLELQYDEGRKLDGWIGYIKTIEMEAAKAREVAAEFAAKAKSRESRAEWMRERIKHHIEHTGRTKVTTAGGYVLAVQANGGKPPLVIDATSPADVPDVYCVTSRQIDRDKVREALERGDAVSFARLLVKGTHLRIK